MLTLPDGTMLMAIYGYEVRPAGQQTASDRNHSYVYRSTDDGRTWRRISEIGGGKLQFNETSLLRLPDGKLKAAMRSRAGSIWIADSSDSGESWTPAKELTPIEVHPPDLTLLPSGRILLTAGNRVGPFGVLGMLSDETGNFDWSKRFTLMNDAIGRDCGYPSNIVLKDGRVLTVYYATRAKEQPGWRVHCGALLYDPTAK
jgi:hypothetical protein